MSELLNHLTHAVAGQSRREKVALLLSGGIDSLSVGLALAAAGKPFHAYTFELEGHSSPDVKSARALAAHFGWPLTVVTVPTSQVADDFLRLAAEQKCRTKIQFEVSYPLAYVFQQIVEEEVWSGFNADDHFGNDRETIFHYRRLATESWSKDQLKQDFDEKRRAKFDGPLADPQSGDSWWFAKRIAARYGKTLHDPYLDRPVRDYFLRFDHAELSPARKPHLRDAFRGELKRLPKGSIAVGVRLQKGAGVSALFSKLLHDERINRFETRYTTVSGLCQQWGAAIGQSPELYKDELQRLLPQPAAKKALQVPAVYRPYFMDEVLSATTHGLPAIEFFAGGGGSAVGLHQAGYDVVLANDFVGAAARSYRANFPDTIVDGRDIREITASHTAMAEYLRQGDLRRGQVGMVAGSFPCAEFCTLGPGLADQEALRSYSDTKQRGVSALAFEFVTAVRMALPETVVAENVPALGLMYAPLLEAVMQMLRFTLDGERRVYYANHAVLSAADFGTPQTRKRLIIIAVRKDVAEAVGINSDEDVLRLMPTPSHLPVSVRSAFTGLSQSQEQLAPWWAVMAKNPTLRDLVRRLPRDPVDLMRPRHIGVDPNREFTLVRTAMDRPSLTLTVLGQLPIGLNGLIHPLYDRKFSLPELMRLTGLPDDFRLTGTLAQAVERVARMVPPALMRAVADSVYQKVLRPYHGHRHD